MHGGLCGKCLILELMRAGELLEALLEKGQSAMARQR